MRSYSTLQLVQSAPEVIERLRDPYAHHGEHRAYLTDSADREFRTLWWAAVNGQFDVPAGGQVKVPTLCGMF